MSYCFQAYHRVMRRACTSLSCRRANVPHCYWPRAPAHPSLWRPFPWSLLLQGKEGSWIYEPIGGRCASSLKGVRDRSLIVFILNEAHGKGVIRTSTRVAIFPIRVMDLGRTEIPPESAGVKQGRSTVLLTHSHFSSNCPYWRGFLRNSSGSTREVVGVEPWQRRFNKSRWTLLFPVGFMQDFLGR